MMLGTQQALSVLNISGNRERAQRTMIVIQACGSAC